MGTLCDLFFAEVVFTYSAKGTYEILGEVLKFGACSDTVIGITHSFVIDPAAYITYVFFHFHFLLKLFYKTKEGAL